MARILQTKHLGRLNIALRREMEEPHDSSCCSLAPQVIMFRLIKRGANTVNLFAIKYDEVMFVFSCFPDEAVSRASCQLLCEYLGCSINGQTASFILKHILSFR